MKNNLHTELRESIEKILQGDLEETRINQLVDLFSDFSLSTSPDAIVKQDTLESLIDGLGKNLRGLHQHEYGWLAESNTVATGDEGTSHYIYTIGSTPREAVSKLLKELKK